MVVKLEMIHPEKGEINYHVTLTVNGFLYVST